MARLRREDEYSDPLDRKVSDRLVSRDPGFSRSPAEIKAGKKPGTWTDKKDKPKVVDPKFGKTITKPTPKATAKTTPKTKTSLASAAKKDIKVMSNVKPKPKPTLTKAEKGIAKELSPKGVAAAEKMAKKAIEKKYPGLYKK